MATFYQRTPASGWIRTRKSVWLKFRYCLGVSYFAINLLITCILVEEIDIEVDHFHTFQTSVTLTLDQVIQQWHNVEYHSSTSTYKPNFIQFQAGEKLLSVDHPTTSENAARAGPESDGSTRSEMTMGFSRRTCRGVRLLVVTEEQRYGPRWLRDNDDDDENLLWTDEFTFTWSSRPKKQTTQNTVKQKLPWFSRLLRHLARKWAGLINDAKPMLGSLRRKTSSDNGHD